MRSQKKCPLLKEEYLLYCKNFPLKRTIYSENVVKGDEKCVGKNYRECSLYPKGSVLEDEKRTVCPFVGRTKLYFCTSMPLRKMNERDISPFCNTPNFELCPVYQKESSEGAKENLTSIHGFQFDETKDYLDGHLWLKKKNGVVRIGFDDFGQCILGKVRKVIVKEKGSRITENTWFAKFRTEEDELEVYAPINGVIECTNEVLNDMPFLLNVDPYRNGWVIEVKPEGQIRTYRAEEAKKLLINDIWKFGEILEKEAGITMADGGEFVKEIRYVLKERGICLIQGFLKVRGLKGA